MWNTALVIVSAFLIVFAALWIGYNLIAKTSRRAGGDQRELGIFKKSTERQAKADYVFRHPQGTDRAWLERQRRRLRRIRGEKS
jgi:hypothetical protein